MGEARRLRRSVRAVRSQIVQRTGSVGGGGAASTAGLTPTSYTILGLLALRSWSGYQLTKQVRRGLGQLWPRAERQLYNDPKRLVEAGYVTAASERVGRRERTTYTITTAGRSALRRWLGTPTRPSSLEFEGMVRVLFADQGTLAQLRATLQDIAEQATAARAEYAGWAAFMVEDGGDFPTRMHTNALAMRFMMTHFTQVIAWAEWALQVTSTWPDTTTPATAWKAEAASIYRDAARHRGVVDDPR
jgi:PadR family transcriptional regulator, regulatory protein AphA